MAERERGDGREQRPAAPHEQDQPRDEQQVIEAAEDVRDAEPRNASIVARRSARAGTVKTRMLGVDHAVRDAAVRALDAHERVGRALAQSVEAELDAARERRRRRSRA